MTSSCGRRVRPQAEVPHAVYHSFFQRYGRSAQTHILTWYTSHLARWPHSLLVVLSFLNVWYHSTNWPRSRCDSHNVHVNPYLSTGIWYLHNLLFCCCVRTTSLIIHWTCAAGSRRLPLWLAILIGQSITRRLPRSRICPCYLLIHDSDCFAIKLKLKAPEFDSYSKEWQVLFADTRQSGLVSYRTSAQIYPMTQRNDRKGYKFYND